MRTLGQSLSGPWRMASSKPWQPSRTHSGSHGPRAGTAAPAPPFLQEFSRIPVHPTSAALQTKLAINQPGDAHEQEANRLAEQVMRRPERWLQRACTCGGTCPKCRKHPASHPGWREAPPIVHEVLSGPGQALHPGARAFFEPRFGVGLADVRIHTNDRAGASARAVGAQLRRAGLSWPLELP